MADDSTTPTNPKGFRSTLGKSGTVILGGMIHSEEYNSDLKGKAGLRVYDRMRRSDSTIRAILQMCKKPIIGLTWSIEAASEDPGDVYLQQLVQKDLMEGNINWESFMADAFTELEFGYSLAEMTMALQEFEGKPAVRTVEMGFRKQTSILKWETEEGKPGVTQFLLGGTASNVSIPREKIVLFTHDREGDNYEGISLLRYCYKDWYMKDSMVKFNGVGLEKMSVGVPVLTFADDMGEPEKERAREVLRQWRANEEGFLEVPEGSKIEMVDMKANSTKDVLPSIQHHDRQIALSVLGQFLMLGAADASGSKAVSSDHSKLFMLSEESLANQFQAAVQEQWIKQLVDLNTSNLPNGYPKLVHSKIDDEDVTVYAEAVNKLVQAKAVTMNYETEQAIREVVHLPALPAEDEETYDEDHAPIAPIIADPNAPPVEKKPPKIEPNVEIKATAALRNLIEARDVIVNLLDEA